MSYQEAIVGGSRGVGTWRVHGVVESDGWLDRRDSGRDRCVALEVFKKAYGRKSHALGIGFSCRFFAGSFSV